MRMLVAVLSVLFPVRLGRIDDLSHTLEYRRRMGRLDQHQKQIEFYGYKVVRKEPKLLQAGRVFVMPGQCNVER